MKKARKLLVLLTVLAMCLMVAVPASAAVKISAKNMTLIKGQSKTLKITGTKNKVKWSSSKKSVAAVTSKGKVTAKGKGTATITAKVDKKKYTCKVKVETPKLSKTSLTVAQGKTATLKLSGTTQKITWTSSNTKIATVTSKGVVKGIKSGSCTITATVSEKKYTCAVKITAPTSSSNLTMGRKNALEKAKSYLRFSAFSREGLIGQLEYEKFSHSDAVYAVDHCGADWNEQALKNAQSYLKHSSFSEQGLIEQLVYEKYTKEQAEYGVENCGADWFEQAAKKAASYLKYSSFSREGLINQLEYEGFTYEQAVYGVEENGY